MGKRRSDPRRTAPPASALPEIDPASIGVAAARLGVALGEEQARQLAAFVALLQKWSAVHNLTAIRSPHEIVTHHLLDSLAIVPYLRRACVKPGARMLDVGTGGGLPGIPVAIACPELHVTLLDAVQKKSAFLTQARVELRLANVDVVCARVEQWQAPPFDCIVSRAFSSLREFVALTGHLLGADGCWLAMKGPAYESEAAALAPQVAVAEVVPLQVPGLGESRTLVVLRRA